jgi:hypothetical protein
MARDRISDAAASCPRKSRCRASVACDFNRNFAPLSDGSPILPRRFYSQDSRNMVIAKLRILSNRLNPDRVRD